MCFYYPTPRVGQKAGECLDFDLTKDLISVLESL